MKKLFAVILAFALIVCFVGCSAADPSQSVANFVNANKTAVEEASSNDILKCEFLARDTSVVYKYTYLDIDELSSDQKKALEDSLGTLGDTFTSTLETIQKEESAISSIILEYYESDGDLVVSKEYK